MKEHQILIVGGGTAGIMVASQLRQANPTLDIGLIEPAETHYYQPAWTLVGANAYKFEDTARPMKQLIPKGVNWIKEYAASFDPSNNRVTTKDGNTFTYEYLVVCPGLKIDPSMVEGLSEVMDSGAVCSNYTNPKHTWDVIKNFKGGTALFTQANTPIKCGGAPQKIMYLADDHFRKSGVRSKSQVLYALPAGAIFGVKEIAETLMDVVDRKDINLRFGHELVKVDGANQIAWYKMGPDFKDYNHKDLKISTDGDLTGIHYDMMHLAPPQRSPDFIKNSPLATAGGWLSVDPKTMQHTKFQNIFGLGDVAELPTAKTGAAIRKQVPVVVANLLSMVKNAKISEKHYDGYSSCPLVTGYGKMVLAEFDYDKKFMPDPKLKQLLLFNSNKEHWRLWILKKYLLPYLYWNKMMKGKDV
ncbi:MAG: NAD(P)/FAD-dependent oxidoreductase [Saprospiraceae bacterium]|nr:NAD(P)/FAD-dependent oxidoreductase [Saprospiraceae bacterium]